MLAQKLGAYPDFSLEWEEMMLSSASSKLSVLVLSFLVCGGHNARTSWEATRRDQEEMLLGYYQKHWTGEGTTIYQCHPSQ